LPLGRLRLELHPIQVGVRNVIFDAGDVYRRALDALDAMPLALLFVVADQRTDHRQGVVAEKHLPRFLQPVLPEQADHVRDGRLDGTACAAAGIFALQAALVFIDNVNGHTERPPSLTWKNDQAMSRRPAWRG